MLTYCLLDEAWGAKPRHTSNQDCSWDKEKVNEPQVKPINKPSVEHFESDMIDCDSVIEHIKNCKKCYNKITSSQRPMILDNLREIVNDNKDLIVLILMGISIVLFFNLINNLTKD